MAVISQPTHQEFMDSVASAANVGDFDPNFSDRANNEWSFQLARYQEAQEYFYGDIFNTRTGDGTDAPLMYPLKINLVRMMCLTQASALWGQWEEDLISFHTTPEKENESARQRAQEAQDVISETYQASGGNMLLYEGGLSQQIYGGVFLRAAIDPTKPHGVRIDKLMPYNVFVIWDPITINRILKAYIAIPIDKNEAKLAYGTPIDTLPDEVIYLEEWSEESYTVSVGGKVLQDFSGKNPWGFIPIVYLPRVRAEGFYGIPLYEDIYGIQNELNARMADVGDNVNNAAHPIRWIKNYRGDSSRDFVAGADQLWDLGQGTPGGEDPEVGVLPAQAEPTSTFHYINFLLDISRQAANTSPVAFGEDEGSQRSGVTLTLRLWPLLQQVKTTRIYWRDQLYDLHRKVLVMAKARDIVKRYNDLITRYGVMPNFADLVPQDRQLLIDEICRRAERDLISPEEALARFGTKAGTEQEERERITAWLEEKNALEVKKMEAQTRAYQESQGRGDSSQSTEESSDEE